MKPLACAERASGLVRPRAPVLVRNISCRATRPYCLERGRKGARSMDREAMIDVAKRAVHYQDIGDADSQIKLYAEG